MVREHLTRDARLIVPVGTLEQHGPHLPLGCDTILVERLADELSREFRVLRAPTVEYGVNTVVPRPFPGNATVRRKTLHRWMSDLLGSWEKSGVDHFIIVTAHGYDPHQEALSTVFTKRAQVQVVDIFAMDFPGLFTAPGGPVHGGELDTSLLLHLAPELVTMSRATDYTLPARRRSSRRRISLTKLPKRSPGSVGSPSRASAELGAQLYRAMYDRIAARIFGRVR